MNKKIAVTGGAGFIGSNLCECLMERKYEVVCLDNFATGKEDLKFMSEELKQGKLIFYLKYLDN